MHNHTLFILHILTYYDFLGLRRNYLHKYDTLRRNFALSFHAKSLGKEQLLSKKLTVSY